MNRADQLYKEHARIEAALEALLSAADVDSGPALQSAWAEVEPQLLEHFAYEEKHLFGALRTRDPETVNRLEQDHATFRRLIAEFGIRSDLHTLRRDMIEELIAGLRAHAELERKTLYPQT